MKKISIIVPVYNVEKYLHRCVDSILAQTYENIEIILVNDGSTDNSPNICNEYKAKDARIKVIHQANSGQSGARNAGLKVATGEYIGFVDSDDWIMPDMYEYLLRIVEENNSEIGDIECLFADKFSNSVEIKDEVIEIYEEKDILWHYLYRGLNSKVAPYSACRKLYKRSFFEKVMFQEGKINEDILANYEILSTAKKIAVSNQCKYFYFQNELSTTTTGFKKKDFDLLKICNEICELSSEENYRKINELAKMKLARSYFSLLAKIARYGFSDNELNRRETIKCLTKGLRNNYLLLMRSPMPFNRKIMATVVCINLNILSIPLNIYFKIRNGRSL